MTRFMWNSLDGGDNLFIKDKESPSDKLIHIKIFDGKYEFAEMMKKINELAEENEQLRKELGDCEKFRYTVFKRLNDEHIKERSIK